MKENPYSYKMGKTIIEGKYEGAEIKITIGESSIEVKDITPFIKLSNTLVGILKSTLGDSIKVKQEKPQE